MEKRFHNHYQQRLRDVFSMIVLLFMGSSIFAQTKFITGAGPYVAPADGTLTVKVVGGGGGGGAGMASTTENRAGGGGAGGNAVTKTFAVTAGASYTMVFGAGGALGTGSGIGNAFGQPGGSSSFTGPGAAIVASGGTGGSGGIVGSPSGLGGVVGGLYYIPVATGGTGYASGATTVNILGGGSGATAIIGHSGGIVNSISLTSQGTGYTSAPTVTFTVTNSASGATVGTPLFNRNIDADGTTVTANGNAGAKNTTSPVFAGAGGTGGGTNGGAGATTPPTTGNVTNGGNATANTGSGGGGGLGGGSTTFRGQGGNGSAGYIEVTFAVLPIELAKFEVKNSPKTAMLTWTTASEKDNAFFDIEQSTNGTDFQTIGQVKGQGTTNAVSNYNFEHGTPSVGANYYRLKQVDYDGTATFSAVRSVLFGKGGLVVKSSLVQTTLDIVTNNESSTTIGIFNMAGQQVLSRKIQGEQRLDVSALPSGLYTIKTATGDTGRFVKQ